MTQKTPDTGSQSDKFAKLAERFDFANMASEDGAHMQARLKEIAEFLPDDVVRDMNSKMEKMLPQAGVNVQDFADMHGLTKAETKLLNSLAQGRSVPEHAKHVSISVNTGRVHMQRILDKTGAASQLQLMKMLHQPP